MQRHVREVKKEADELIKAGEIEDYRLDNNSKKRTLTFLRRGKWHSVSFSSSPRTTYTRNFVRQQVRRTIKGE